MAWKVDIAFLRSKVARRVFLLFVVCAMLPILALALISFRQVTEQLREQSRKQLQQESKTQGMNLFERLRNADAEMRLLAANPDSPRGETVGIPTEQLQEHFLSLARVDPKGAVEAVLGKPRMPEIPAGERERAAGRPLILTQPAATPGTSRVWIVRELAPGGSTAPVLVGEVNPDYLWGAENLGSNLQLCVLDQTGSVLYCPSGNPQTLREGVLRTPGSSISGAFGFEDDRQGYQAGYWTAFLRSGFASPSWVVVVFESEDAFLIPLQHFQSVFPLVMLLALWVVLLLSLIQIRRTLVPLERLQQGTQRIANQEFDARVSVTSGDEFQELAGSFNAMAGRLGQQFQALKTIDEIDRAILSSLNQEEILDTALFGMEGLLPYDGICLCLLDSEAALKGKIYLPRKQNSEAGARHEVRDVRLRSSDVQQLCASPQHLAGAIEQSPPPHLRPLAERGMRAFLALPILQDDRLFAILVLGYLGPPALSAADLHQARQIADQLGVAFSNARLVAALDQLHWGTLTALARAIDAKSPWTSGHSERVTHLAVDIGKFMGLPPKELAIMHRGGLLHDIGKIGTPPSILDKAGKLEGEELQVMRDHVRVGTRILEPIPGFAEILPIVQQHHEWWNGKGYPAGLAGEAISLHARIFAVADCYDALISDRPYRAGMPQERVLAILEEGSGTQFDPQVVEAFLQFVAERQRESAAPAASLATAPLAGWEDDRGG
ncbi:MAG TPA: HD domain-containing phosphohydrolase [Terriglobales bacterium]|nr:HD domain-containing phosphohydrolase [Terriglobales bacterium]